VNTLRIAWALVAALSVASGCNFPPEKEKKRGSDPAQTSADGNASRNAGDTSCSIAPRAVPSPRDDAGLVVITIPLEGYDPCTVTGYVVGLAESTAVVNAGGGVYFLDGVPEGAQDIVLAAHRSGSSDADLGVRLTGVNVAKARKVEQTARFFGLGTLAGTAKLAGQKAHNGVTVRIPGTSYAATTDAAGAYAIAGVPAGVHNLELSADGYHGARAEGVRVYSDATARAPDVVLVAGAGEGVLALLDDHDEILPGDLPQVASRVVRFVIAAKGKPKLMKVSEDGDFANLDWQPFQSVGTYTFRKDGLENGGRTTKRLSVLTLEAATQNELERSVQIDVYPETRGAKVMTASATDTNGETSLDVALALTVPAAATEMRTSLFSDFRGADWVPAAKTATLHVTATGDYTAYAQFRDRDLLTTDVFSQVVHVELFPKGSLAVTLAASVVTFPAAASVRLSTVTSPRRTGVRYLVGLNADLSDARELDPAAAIEVRLGATDRGACGVHRVYLGARYVDPVSNTVVGSTDVASAAVEYRCFAKIAAIPGEPLESVAFAQGGNYVLAFGGAQVNPNSNSSLVDYGQILDLTAGKWSLLSPIHAPSGRQGARAFYVDGKFVVYGGYTVGSTDTFFDGGVLDPATGAWTPIPEPTDVPTIDGYATLPDLIDWTKAFVGVAGHKLVMYGNDGDDAAPLGYVYDLDAGTWSTIKTAGDAASSPSDPKYVDAAAPLARCQSNSDQAKVPVLVGRKLVVWGGLVCDSSTNVATTGAMYDLDTGAWTAMATSGQPAPRYDHAAFAHDGKLVVWGGRTIVGGQESYDGMETGGIFDPATNSWASLPAAPFSMHLGDRYDVPGLFGASVAGKLVFWAGWHGASRIWRGLVYDVAASKWREVTDVNAPRYLGTVSSPPGSGSDRAYRDLARADASTMYVLTRARDRTELGSDAVLAAAFDVATETWRALPNTSNDFAAKFSAPAFRDVPRAFPTASGLLVLHGYAPEPTTTYDQVQMDGALLFTK
jgi:hypothetical protein